MDDTDDYLKERFPFLFAKEEVQEQLGGQRKFPRIELAYEARFFSEAVRTTAQLINIAAGGVALLTPQPLKMEGEAVVMFEIEDELEGVIKISALCQIKHTTELPNGAGHVSGLKFTNLAPTASSALEKYLATRASAATA